MDKSEYTLAERDCEHCKNHVIIESDTREVLSGCTKWSCEYEPEEETCEKNARS